MKKKIFFFEIVVLFFAIFTIQGCVSTAYELGYKAGYSTSYKKRMNTMIEGIYNQKIPLNNNPLLPWHEKTLLGTISPLKICLETFRDLRIGIDGKIPRYQESVDLLITKAIGNELERNNHVVIKDSTEKNNCDFVISGEIEDFSSLPFNLIKDEKFKEENNNYNWITRVIFEIEVEGTKNCDLRGTRNYTKKWLSNWANDRGWDAVPSFEQVGKKLDETLLNAIKDFSNDEDLIQMLQCYPIQNQRQKVEWIRR